MLGSGVLAVYPPEHEQLADDVIAHGALISEVPPLTEPVHYETILTEAQFDDWLGRLQAAPLAAFDTETDSLDPMAARLVGLSFSVTPGQAAYIPLHHDYPGVPPQLDPVMVLPRATMRSAASGIWPGR